MRRFKRTFTELEMLVLRSALSNGREMLANGMDERLARQPLPSSTALAFAELCILDRLMAKKFAVEGETPSRAAWRVENADRLASLRSKQLARRAPIPAEPGPQP